MDAAALPDAQPIDFTPTRLAQRTARLFQTPTVRMIFSVIGMVATLGLMVGAFAMVPFADTGVRFSFTVSQVLQWLAVVLPAGLLAAAIEVHLASFARTFKEAQQYMGFVIMVPMLGLMGSMAFPEVTGLWLAPVPIFGQFELAKAILAGESPAAIWYVVSTLSLAGCTAALIGLTARLFSSEKLIVGQ